MRCFDRANRWDRGSETDYGDSSYDGCSYQSPERDEENGRAFDRVTKVTEVIRCAVEEAGITAVQVDHMLPVLDRLHLQAVSEAQRVTQTELGLIAYILIPVMLDSEMCAYSPRAHSTFYAHNERIGGDAFREHIRTDPIVQYNIGKGELVTPETVAPYTEEEAAGSRSTMACWNSIWGSLRGVMSW